MPLRSKLSIAAAMLLAVLVYITYSLDRGCGFAQSASGKPGAAKVSEQAKAKAGGILVTFVEIGAARCIPCKAMQPIMKEVAEEYKGQVNVLFHDVWTSQGRIDAEKYGIRMIPTQVFLDRQGREYYRHEGYFPKHEVVKVIRMQGVK